MLFVERKSKPISIRCNFETTNYSFESPKVRTQLQQQQAFKVNLWISLTQQLNNNKNEDDELFTQTHTKKVLKIFLRFE